MKIPRQVIQSLSEWGQVRENELLKNYTTFKTGGPADVLVAPMSNRSISHIVTIAAENQVPLTVIGGGSNLLVGDYGIEGVVLWLCENGGRKAAMSVLEDGTLYADAMTVKENFISYAVDAGFSGVAFMAGIPGCIGGGIMMNAGTFMGTFSEIVKDVDIVDQNGDDRTVAIDRARTSYRNMNIGAGNIITGARFVLERTDDREGELNKMREVLADRGKKHPLDYPSAGSVFKNPDGHSSWKLINDAGLKGAAIGGASVSELHTNFIINLNNATSQDIRDLISKIRETVYQKFGIELETEVKMMGAFERP
ncbi:MAG: UDP-N-acetylmuramate dehydrogenase [Spirochaetes bacterium]|nr:UDP-N-acetylmuramate dehydrogenase [Spirochaetota bacterium]